MHNAQAAEKTEDNANDADKTLEENYAEGKGLPSSPPNGKNVKFNPVVNEINHYEYDDQSLSENGGVTENKISGKGILVIFL